MSYEAFCECSAYRHWYIAADDGPPTRVCWCGHPDSEHLDGTRSCVGTVTVHPATAGTEEGRDGEQ